MVLTYKYTCISVFDAVVVNGVFYKLFLSADVFENTGNVNKHNSSVSRWFIITLSLSIFCYPTFLLSDLIVTLP